jgi:6,7-dimethyl-8-ribityllumazine synthase
MRDPQSEPLPAADLRVGIVVSRYHGDITMALRDGAVRAFNAAGGREADLKVIESPGAFELTVLCTALVRSGDVDAVVALGCIVAGDTAHDQYLAHAVAHGLTMLSVDSGVPVAFGVLTVQTLQQARDRAGGAKGNKGEEAMAAAIASAITIRSLLSRTEVG